MYGFQPETKGGEQFQGGDVSGKVQGLCFGEVGKQLLQNSSPAI